MSSIAVKILAVFTILIVIAIGVGLGLSLAMTANIKNQENFIELAPALPTRLLDVNGDLITEFASDEKRELVPLSEMPRHLIHAILAREDPDFYNHRGFSIKAITRAFVGKIIKKNLGGGSTITQQVAKTLYTDGEYSLRRKMKELWWAFQLERRYTKNEILEIYINYMNMGPGTYGVETASKYFFGHSAKEVDLAESAVLAILLSSPSGFNPLSNPNAARDRQHFVLERMIKFGYADADEAETSFNEYWENFDWTRPSISAYYNREDKAPWFSEYVRRQLTSMIYGTGNLYRDGYIVYTTLDLRHQQTAERLMIESLEKANKEVAALNKRSGLQAERTYRSIVDMLTLYFDLTEIRSTAANQGQARAVARYAKNVNPIVDMAALVFGISELKEATNVGYAHLKENTEQNVVEGALISIENETGYITSIVGGSKYDESNQLIRATQSFVQPGSAFKPLYYSAAIDSRKFTASTLLYDAPMVFYNNDDTPYIPSNYGGLWRGPILLYNALSLSLNIPALIVLEGIGFDAAINRSAALLGITNEADIRRIFPRVYPLGLGVIATSPIQMARAFAIFANQGRVVTPIAIRKIEDRNGRVIHDVAREELQRQQRMGSNIQIITPQNAYVMTRIMERAATGGTLAYGAGNGTKFTYLDEKGNSYRIPVAGKTGTTQNWSDAWAVGYSPYYTTAVWFGFDKAGSTLGQNQTGAVLAGPVWGDLMREMHKGLPQKAFARPSTGVVEVAVCLKSGLLRNEYCNEGETWLPFLSGTQPIEYCKVHTGSSPLMRPIPGDSSPFGLDGPIIEGFRMPTLDLDILPELREQPRNNQRTPPRNNNRTPSAPPPDDLFFEEDDFNFDDALPGWSPLN